MTNVEQLELAIGRILGMLAEGGYAKGFVGDPSAVIIYHKREDAIEIAGTDHEAVKSIYLRLTDDKRYDCFGTRLHGVTWPEFLASLKPEEIEALQQVGVLTDGNKKPQLTAAAKKQARLAKGRK